MTNGKYTEEFQKALNDYIKLGFNQDECTGFMHGFHKGAEAQQLSIHGVSNSASIKSSGDFRDDDNRESQSEYYGRK